MPVSQEVREAFAHRERDPDAPMPILRALMPSDKERNHISLYQIEDNEDPLFLLAAFSLISKGRFIVVHVDKEAVEKIGVRLVETEADTDNSEVNKRHIDCFFLMGQQAMSLATTFLHGTVAIYEPVEVRKQIIKDHLSGELNLKAAAKICNANRPAMICELIAQGACEIVTPVAKQ